MLEKMEKRYADRFAELEVVLEEKRRLGGNTLAEIERSWQFYQRRVKEGAGMAERLYTLEKIETKYPQAGAALEGIRREHEKVERAQRAAEAAARFRPEWDAYKARAAVWGDEEERLSLLNQWEAEYEASPEAVELIRAERLRIAPDLGRPAYPAHDPKKLVKGFMRLDTWVREKVYEQDKADAAAAVPGYLSIGYDSASAAAKETGGLGMRGGVFWLSRKRPVALGGSVGYVLGPDEEVTLNAVSDFAEDGRQQKLVETDFMRVMLEAQTRTPLTRRTELRIGGGVGLARGRIRQDTGNAGSFVSALEYPASQSNTRTWDGVTWEVSPALAFIGEVMQVELGLSYALFPSMDADNTFNAFDWSPVGLHLKFEF